MIDLDDSTFDARLDGELVDCVTTKITAPLAAKLGIIHDKAHQQKTTYSLADRERYDEVVLLGHQINDLLGFDGLQVVAYLANRHFERASSMLNYIWDGIGEWEA